MGFDFEERNGSFNVKLTGLDALIEKLTGEAPGSIMSAIAEGSHEAEEVGSAMVKEAIVANAPKMSGFMSEHISIVWEPRQDDGSVRVFIKPNSKAVYPAGADRHGDSAANAMEVAIFNEFGHTVWHISTRGKSKGTKIEGRRNMGTVNPFFTSGFESSKTSAFEAMVAAVGVALEKLNT